MVVATVSPGEQRIPSRAIHKFVPLPNYKKAPDEFGRALRRTIEEFNPDLLVPASDAALLALIPHFHETRRWVEIASPPPATVRKVLDKGSTMEIAVGLGIPTPRGYNLPDLAALEANRPFIEFPLISKARDKAFESKDPFMKRHRDFDWLKAAFQNDPEFGRRFLLEEQVPGDSVGVAMLMRQGQPLATFRFATQRCIRAQAAIRS